jgi:hypothetical protein
MLLSTSWHPNENHLVVLRTDDTAEQREIAECSKEFGSGYE